MRVKLYGGAVVASACLVTGVFAATASATSPTQSGSDGARSHAQVKPRTIVTTDIEQDDLASLVRYLYYTNDVDTQGIVYTASRFHWAGDGLGTKFFLAGREYTTPETSWRWAGSNIIQDAVIPAYGKVYPHLVKEDRSYPSPASLLAKVQLGNIDFEGEMDHDTAGSNLIKSRLLDNDQRPLYLQVWGGTNTIARALKSIADDYAGSPRWAQIKDKIDHKAIILASGFQDDTYANYIAKAWPEIKVEQLSAGYSTWGYNCNFGNTGNVRGLPADREFFQGSWIKANIEIGPLGSLYRSWLDGQAMPGDPLDIFGDPAKAPSGWCPPLQPYDFLSEGDDVAYMPLLKTGIGVPGDPNLGSWGGRAVQTSTSPNLWTMVPTELDASGNPVKGYTTSRWEAAAWNDFANRIQWGLTADPREANHAPAVWISTVRDHAVKPGQTVTLHGAALDPDHNALTVQWWQYREEGTYPGVASVSSPHSLTARVTIPADAQRGQTLSFMLQATDNGKFPLTRYARIILRVG